MGIPSYFSYIVKNHSNIIKKLSANTIKVDNLYLDCNSIIYDAVHNIDFSKLVESDMNTIIRAVCVKIDEYILQIKMIMKHIKTFESFLSESKLNESDDQFANPDLGILAFAWLEFTLAGMQNADYSQNDSNVKKLLSDSTIKGIFKEIAKQESGPDPEKILRIALAANAEAGNGEGNFDDYGSNKHWTQGLEDLVGEPMPSIMGTLQDYRRYRTAKDFANAFAEAAEYDPNNPDGLM